MIIIIIGWSHSLLQVQQDQEQPTVEDVSSRLPDAALLILPTSEVCSNQIPSPSTDPSENEDMQTELSDSSETHDEGLWDHPVTQKYFNILMPQHIHTDVLYWTPLCRWGADLPPGPEWQAVHQQSVQVWRGQDVRLTFQWVRIYEGVSGAEEILR